VVPNNVRTDKRARVATRRKPSSDLKVQNIL
jgi:hypothetical protein